MNKKISKEGLNLIKQFEGLRLRAYKPVLTEKYWTIGYGHYGADVLKDMSITQAQAEDFLKKDLEKFENAVNDCVKVEITSGQFDSLVSFAYNCGASALKGSTLLRELNQGNFFTAANKFLDWVRSGSTVLEGLVKRRKAERKLFLAGCKRVTSNFLNVRKGIGTSTPVVKVLKKFDVIPIFEVSGNWGRTSFGWVCLDYLEDV